MPPKKKPKIGKQGSLFGSDKAILDGMNLTYKGSRILLKAKDIYPRGQIPAGEEPYLFQYHIEKINPDRKTATLKFDEMYVVDGDHRFLNYALTDEESREQDATIDDYVMNGFKADEEEYNMHIGRANKIRNDRLEAQRAAAEEEKVASSEDLFDIERKIEDKADAYQLLLLEFESDGPLLTHTIAKGAKQGQTSFKQQWRHSNSGYTFVWHRKFGKTEFVRDRLWKAVRVVIARQVAGAVRLQRIMDYAHMSVGADDPAAKYPREQDMLNRTHAVFAIAGGKLALSAFDEGGMREYLGRLDPRHTPPHRLERIRLLAVALDRGVWEFSQIVAVCVCRVVCAHASHSQSLHCPSFISRSAAPSSVPVSWA